MKKLAFVLAVAAMFLLQGCFWGGGRHAERGGHHQEGHHDEGHH